MLVFFWNIESPIYYIGKNMSSEKLRANFSRVFKTIYAESEIPHVIAFAEKNMEQAEDVEDVTITQLFTKKHRFRFFISIFINIAQQMSGINFLILYSKQFFDDISGNG